MVSQVSQCQLIPLPKTRVSEYEKIIRLLTPIERSIFVRLGGVIPRHVPSLRAEWFNPKIDEVKQRKRRKARSHGIGGVRIHVHGLGTFPSIRQAAIAIGVSDRTFRDHLAADRKWLGGWRVKVIKLRKAA